MKRLIVVANVLLITFSVFMATNSGWWSLAVLNLLGMLLTLLSEYLDE